MRFRVWKSALSAPLALCIAAAPIQAENRPPKPAAGPRWQRTAVYRPAAVAQLDLASSARVGELLRAGNLYLTLRDAIALAVENNLDIELQRWRRDMAGTDVLRAQGGGTLRGVTYTVQESPSGVGGPASPLLTSSSRSVSSNVATDPTGLTPLGQSQANLSVQNTAPLSSGPAVPGFDPAVVGQLNMGHQATPQVSFSSYGTPVLETNSMTANSSVVQGFSSGATASLGFYNTRQSMNSTRSDYGPFTSSTFGLTLTQPLLRGFGRGLNRRFIRIAQNEVRISRLVLEQQLVATVYGVSRLYTDFLALYQDVKVKQETLSMAQKLYEDTKAQVEEGTVAPMELTRANAQVFSSRQDLITAQGLLEEQEAILKNQLFRRGLEEDQVRAARILPLDSLDVPERDEVRPFQDLVTQAVASRPDLAQAGLQVENTKISLEGAKNGLLPQVDLVATAQNSGLAGQLNSLNPALGPDQRYLGGYTAAMNQIATWKYPTYAAGVQVTLPLRNRVAQADAARDQLQLRESEVRLRQLRNQVQLEIEAALIALRRSRAAYEAAVETRKLQEQALQNEQARYEVGASTTYFVIQYETILSQAKSTELAAKSAYLKSRAALQRATGAILNENGVVVE